MQALPTNRESVQWNVFFLIQLTTEHVKDPARNISICFQQNQIRNHNQVPASWTIQTVH